MKVVDFPQLKTCTTCLQEKPITDFYLRPWKGAKKLYHYYCSPCKECHQIKVDKWQSRNRDKVSVIKKRYIDNHPEKRKETLANWFKKMKREQPWRHRYFAARSRCLNPKSSHYRWYGKKGIRFKITMAEFKKLWFRDKAYLMKRASIDRIDNNGNYELKNCRFIEQSENSRRKRRLNGVQVKEIRELYVNGKLTNKLIAERFEVSPSIIGGIISGEYYSDFA